MPIYEYQCQECGHELEIIHKVAESPKRKCPKCGGPMRKKVSAPAIQFKGKGWYVTDYARAGKAGSEGAKDKTKAGKTPAPKKETGPASSDKE